MNKELRHGSNNLHVQKIPIAGDRTGECTTHGQHLNGLCFPLVGKPGAGLGAMRCALKCTSVLSSVLWLQALPPWGAAS